MLRRPQMGQQEGERDSVTIAVDAMGGDNAPRMVVDGLSIVVNRSENMRFILFGRETDLGRLVNRHRRLRAVVEIRDTLEVVQGTEKPSVALRNGRNSSMRRAIDAVFAGEAEGVVSAGNTGALMAMAKFVLKTLPGVHRPAIATVLPTRRGRSVMLDLGANVDCTAENLVQFAVMGEVFARRVLGLERPSVGILNVGEEEAKGREAVRKAAALLQASDLQISFDGFVEGDDIAAGTVDVVVTDGFTGNVALKTAEGVARLYTQILMRTLKSSPVARLGAVLAWRALKGMRQRVDPRYYDGAMFLGLNGVCVKSHGGTDAIGFASAVRTAAQLIRDRVNEGIREDFGRLADPLPTNGRVATSV